MLIIPFQLQICSSVSCSSSGTCKHTAKRPRPEKKARSKQRFLGWGIGSRWALCGSEFTLLEGPLCTKSFLEEQQLPPCPSLLVNPSLTRTWKTTNPSQAKENLCGLLQWVTLQSDCFLACWIAGFVLYSSLLWEKKTNHSFSHSCHGEKLVLPPVHQTAIAVMWELPTSTQHQQGAEPRPWNIQHSILWSLHKTLLILLDLWVLLRVMEFPIGSPETPSV